VSPTPSRPCAHLHGPLALHTCPVTVGVRDWRSQDGFPARRLSGNPSHPGAWKVSHVLVCISSHMPRPEDPGRPSGFLRDRILCLGFRGVKHVAICIRISRLYQTSGQYGCPCGLCDSLCTLRKGCSMKENSMSVPPATLATGGSLRLTRRGLAPRKMHQASLGALTPALCRRSRALCGRKAPIQPPKRLGRARMPKLPRAGAVSTNALLAAPAARTPLQLRRNCSVFSRIRCCHEP
jgi:hypothetical protein